MHGKGIYFDNYNNKIYEGEFVEDKRSGFGEEYHTNGNFFTDKMTFAKVNLELF